jgi:hypothetical protein
MLNNAEYDISGLNTKTRKLWAMIAPRAGVVMLKGKAGIAKSATCKFISDNVKSNTGAFKGEKLQFLDLRLSQMDETHFGFPYRKTEKSPDFDKNLEVMHHALPEWFHEACERPTLINFEELNRCSQDVQNAALEILNERTLHGHALPDHVFMIATGNKGEEDGCAVQEFDNALINRLIMVDFDMNFKEWKENFAQEHVNDYIIRFLEESTEHYYTSTKNLDVGKPFATPRSWTNFSAVIDKKPDIKSIIKFVEKYGSSYIGSAATVSFTTWLNEEVTLNLAEVLEGTDKISRLSRAEKHKIIQDIQRDCLTVEELKEYQIANLIKFFSYVEQDAIASFCIEAFQSDFCTQEKDSPDYKWAKTYSYLKNPVFKEGIKALKTGYKSEEEES